MNIYDAPSGCPSNLTYLLYGMQPLPTPRRRYAVEQPLRKIARYPLAS